MKYFNDIKGEVINLEDEGFDHLRGLDETALMSRGFFPYSDNKTKERYVQGGIECDGEMAYGIYYTEDEFKERKKFYLDKLMVSYERTIDLVVRKATQDLAFGDIQEIPKSVVREREKQKAEYHSKRKAIIAAHDALELKTIII